MKLSSSFYNRDTRTVAQDLLGKYLIRRDQDHILGLRISETEAYIGRLDKACHAYHYRRTQRTAPLFSSPGTIYIYMIYGKYYCLNFVTEPENEPAAVLIRSGQPRVGTDLMALRRFGQPYSALSPYQRKNFLNGPGKLCQALSLTRLENGISSSGDTLFICDDLSDLGSCIPDTDRFPFTIQSGPRVGIDYAEEAAAFPWRYQIVPTIEK